MLFILESRPKYRFTEIIGMCLRMVRVYDFNLAVNSCREVSSTSWNLAPRFPPEGAAVCTHAGVRAMHGAIAEYGYSRSKYPPMPGKLLPMDKRKRLPLRTVFVSQGIIYFESEYQRRQHKSDGIGDDNGLIRQINSVNQPKQHS